MSLLELLGLKRRTPTAAPPDALTEIAAGFDGVEPERARFVAAFAYVLSRVAHADLAVSAAERDKMTEILVERGHLGPAEARSAVEVAGRQTQRHGGTEDYLATREFRRLSTEEQRSELLDCLFAVSAADGSISGREEQIVGQVASELGFSRSELVAVRSRWNDYRAILQPSEPPSG